MSTTRRRGVVLLPGVLWCGRPGCPSRRDVCTTRRRGVVLLLVLVVVAMLALASVTFCDLMLNERRAAETAGRQARARVFA